MDGSTLLSTGHKPTVSTVSVANDSLSHHSSSQDRQQQQQQQQPRQQHQQQYNGSGSLKLTDLSNEILREEDEEEEEEDHTTDNDREDGKLQVEVELDADYRDDEFEAYQSDSDRVEDDRNPVNK